MRVTKPGVLSKWATMGFLLVAGVGVLVAVLHG